MIYTVECSFADPASEAEWNDFYSLEKLPALISVQGFHSSQRFKALRRGCPTYLAVHAIDGLPARRAEVGPDRVLVPAVVAVDVAHHAAPTRRSS